MSKKLVLSVCIPTFGGSDRLETGLRRLVEYRGDDLEIIICDNDNTGKIQPILSKFNDGRLHYYANDKNFGPLYNWIKVLTLGSGKYLLTLNDNDWIAEGVMPHLLKFLYKEDASVIVGYPHAGGCIHYTSGDRNAYSCTGEETHPSCFMLRKDKIDRIDNIFALTDKVDAYMQCTLALICCKDDKVCVNRKISVIEMPDEEYYVSHIARSTKEMGDAHGGFYYTPDGAEKMFRSYTEICREFYPPKSVNRMIPYLYKAQLKRATIEYRDSSRSNMMTTRYGLPYRSDININQERKKFCHRIINDIKNEVSISILVKIHIITVLDKLTTDKNNIKQKTDEMLYNWIQKSQWAKQIQKIWRRVKGTGDN